MNILKFLGTISSFLLFLWIQGCGTDCPGRKVDDLTQSRVSDLKGKVAKMSDEALKNLLAQYKLNPKISDGLELNIKPQQVIVKFVNGTNQSKIQQVLSVLNSSVKYTFKANNALLLDVKDTAISKKDIIGIAMALAELNSVEYATPNMLVKAIDIPSDPLYGSQDDLNPNSTLGPLVNIHVQEAWKKTQGSRSVLVGIIDTGIDYNHPDLKENIWTNPGESGPWMPADPNSTSCRDKSCNGIDDDGNGYIDDVHGYNFVSEANHDPMDDHYHGTHVAGTIGAVANNQLGIAGINWQVSLVALKFLDANGSGSVADAVRAVEYATKMKIPITNNSWGGGGADPTLKVAIAAAGKEGSLFVAAAGNDASDNDSFPSYPASYNLDNVISVAAVDSQGALAYFSNFGVNSVHLAAPGVGVLSTTTVKKDPSGYVRLSGTSMATPHVAGAAALLKALFPSSTPLQLKSRLVYSTTKLAGLDGKVLSGGVLNIEAAMVDDQVAPNPVENLKITMSGITKMSLQWSPSGDNGRSGQSSFYLARLSAQPLQSESDWDSAQPVSMAVTNLGSPDSSPIRGEIRALPLNSKGFVTVRAADHVGNLSPLNSSLPYKLATPLEILTIDAKNKLDVNKVTFVPQKVWGTEQDKKRGLVFSDSPGKLYEDNTDASMILPPVQIVFPDALIQFDTKVSCEAGMDWATVEYQINNELDPVTLKPLWRQLASYSAMGCDWASVSLQIGEKVASNDIVTFRFHFVSDSSGREDGWLIQNIKILGVSPPNPPSNATLAVLDSPSIPYLYWFDQSEDETRFEIGVRGDEKKGDITFQKFYETEPNVTYLDYPGSLSDPKSKKLRVRACNGYLCSATSEVAVIRPMTTLLIYKLFSSATQDYLFSKSTSSKMAGYQNKGVGLKLFDQNLNGRLPVYSCEKKRGGAHFLSNSAICSGGDSSRLELLGFVDQAPSLTPNPNGATNKIFNCSNNEKTRFLYTSNDSECTRQKFNIDKGQLGFGIPAQP